MERQRQRETVEEAMLDDQFLEMIKEDKESWLQAIIEHLEMFLKKANKDSQIQQRIAKHYPKRERNTRAKLKAANEKIEALSHQKEKERLEILSEASLQA